MASQDVQSIRGMHSHTAHCLEQGTTLQVNSMFIASLFLVNNQQLLSHATDVVDTMQGHDHNCGKIGHLMKYAALPK